MDWCETNQQVPRYAFSYRARQFAKEETWHEKKNLPPRPHVDEVCVANAKQFEDSRIFQSVKLGVIHYRSSLIKCCKTDVLAVGRNFFFFKPHREAFYFRLLSRLFRQQRCEFGIWLPHRCQGIWVGIFIIPCLNLFRNRISECRRPENE